MDRRTLLAFVMATLVLVGWGVLFPTHKAPQRDGADSAGPSPVAGRMVQPSTPETLGPGLVPPPAADSTPALGRPPEAAPSQAAAAGEPSWKPALVDTIRIETDLIEAKILTRGGGLVGLTLKDFPSGYEPGAVNLVRAGQEALDVTLDWGEQKVALSGAPYSVRREQRIEGETRAEDVILEAHSINGIAVTRKYTFRDRSYEVGHVIEVTGIPAGVTSPQLVVGWRSGIPYTEGSRQADEQFFAAMVRVGDEFESWAPGKFKQGQRRLEGAVRWVAASNKYFLAALIPKAGTASAAGADGDPTSFRNAVWLEFPASSASGGLAELALYLGPKDFERLNALGVGLGDAVSLGYRWMRPLSGLLLRALKGTYAIIPNYGWVIIVLSVLVRVLVFPLSQASMKSMKAMQNLAPHIEKLRKEYRDKPQELQKRMMQLYKKHRVNPVGGCLPMVLQMPVLFALYYVLMFAIELRMAPFFLWINDLSAPDTVARVGGFPVHVLPLIMTGVSVLQAKNTPKDPQQAMITTLMPIMFLVFFYGMPSGLVLYWTVTSLGTWAQQAWVNRRHGGLAPPPGEVEAPEDRKAGDVAADIVSPVGGGDGDGARVAPKPRVAGSSSRRRRR